MIKNSLKVIGTKFGRSISNYDKQKVKTTQITDFELIRTIGIGYYSEVKLAKWNDAPYAIKIVNKKHALELRQGHNLIREQELLKTIDHPFIMKWYSIFAI